MKTFLVKSIDYADYTDYIYAEIWAAESKEQIWDIKHPEKPIGFVPDFKPKRESYPTDEMYNKSYKRYIKKKDKWVADYLNTVNDELEGYIELNGVSNNETSIKMISKHLIASKVFD